MRSLDDEVSPDRRASRSWHCGAVQPELVLDTERMTLDETVDCLLAYIEQRVCVAPAGAQRG